MPDIVDQASESIDREAEYAIRAARSSIPAGEPGECEECGQWFERVVNSMCGRCRDELGAGYANR